ncbi:MAG TPA: serine hydrolase [Stellaceae bacterium]|nr:serine hydrolase [Stellaceae bacterium]
MRVAFGLAMWLALWPGLAPAAFEKTCAAPSAMADGWPVAAPAEAGLDPKVLCSIGLTLEHLQNADPHAVVIVRHGALAYEHYFPGGDEYMPGEVVGRVDRDVETRQDVHSVTKSVTALLAGILVDRGKLQDLDASVFSFLPQYGDLRTAEKARISLRDLLTMTSGLALNETGLSYSDPANAWRHYVAAPDPFRFVLEQPLAAAPGTVWNYNSGGVELLGLILQKLAGEDLGRFAKDSLFTPLGISDFGFGAASFGLTIRPRDLAKIGQLVLNRGVWHGRQIVSARWIDEMTARHVPLGRAFSALPADSYGYLWWRGGVSSDRRKVGWVGGVGYGGQRLFVVPSLDMVVAVTAGVYTQTPQGRAGDTALRVAVRAATNRPGR